LTKSKSLSEPRKRIFNTEAKGGSKIAQTAIESLSEGIRVMCSNRLHIDLLTRL